MTFEEAKAELEKINSATLWPYLKGGQRLPDNQPDAFSRACAARRPEMIGEMFYTASFCEQDDLLNQWRGYSRHEDGYSVAFRPMPLVTGNQTMLFKMIYDPEVQHELLSGRLGAISLLLSGVDLPETQVRSLVDKAHDIFRMTVFIFKDRSFSGEQEWRLLAGKHSGYIEKFRVIDGHFIPYVSLNAGPGVISGVTQGPGRYRNANTRALTRLLASTGYPGIPIRKSAVPI